MGSARKKGLSSPNAFEDTTWDCGETLDVILKRILNELKPEWIALQTHIHIYTCTYRPAHAHTQIHTQTYTHISRKKQMETITLVVGKHIKTVHSVFGSYACSPSQFQIASGACNCQLILTGGGYYHQYSLRCWPMNFLLGWGAWSTGKQKESRINISAECLSHNIWRSGVRYCKNTPYWTASRRATSPLSMPKVKYVKPWWTQDWRTERHFSIIRCQTRWDAAVNGRWTYLLIPRIDARLNWNHGEVHYYLTQMLSGHDCL